MAEQINNEQKIQNQNNDTPIITISSNSSQLEILDLLRSIPNHHSEQQQIDLLNQLSIIIKQIDVENVDSVITEELLNEIKNQIGEAQSMVQKELLNILGQIAEFGADITRSFQYNKFYKIFNKSQLDIISKDILLKQVQNDEKEMKGEIYSQSAIQLAQTFGFINKQQTIQDNIIIIFGKVFSSHIKKLFENLYKYSNSFDTTKNYSNKIDIQFENQIIFGTRTLKSIKGLIYNHSNQKYLIDNLKIHEIIRPLIHINCPPELNCSQILTLPESEIVQNLSGTFFNVFENIAYAQNIYQYLQDNDQIFDHIYPIIISFSSTISDEKQQNSKQFLTNTSSSTILLVERAIKLLYYLLVNIPTLCEYALLTPNVVTSLITLTKFNRKIQKKIINNIQSAIIREDCHSCISQFWNFESEKIKKMMMNEWKFIQQLIERLGICGGNEESHSNVIIIIIIQINQLLEQINEGSEDYRSLPGIKQQTFEDIEESGGIEEIESHIFHSKEMRNYVKYHINKAVKQLNNQMKKYNK